MYYWTTSSGRIELAFRSLEDVQACCHPGQCDADVMRLSEPPDIAEQLARLPAKTVRRELAEYGAWDADELADHKQNLQRLLWIAACDVDESPGDYS